MKRSLVFATNNPNKLKEIQSLVPSYITVKGLSDIGCTEDILEDAPTIEGNAILKARYVFENYGYDCFADDTGLEVSALNGQPGVFSARYAGTKKNANDNMNKLLANLATHSDRKARFKTVIAFAKADLSEILTFEGVCKGQITKERKGDSGFGYDPIFLPDGYDTTFAQMSLSLKNKIGHRGKAMAKFLTHLNK